VILTGFSELDALCGGLQEEKNYLLYGNIGVGKSTFALQFLNRGLLAGENGVLVIRRSAQTVLDQARAFGMDLDPFVRSGQLIVFEYTARVIENATRLRDSREIWNEFEALLGGDRVRRLIFDPIPPLLSSPSSSAAVFRARTLIQSFSELGATALYIFDNPEGEDYLANCKDFVYGVLRFEAEPFQAGRGRLILERFPELKALGAPLAYEIVPGLGLTAVAAPAPVAPEMAGEEARKVLVVEPCEQARALFCELLSKQYQVLVASDGSDALAKVAAESPDLVITEMKMPGLSGLELTRKLRQNRINIPIVLVGEQIRRARDQIEFMAAGADECLERPLDGRILRLKVQNLLHRYDASKDRLRSKRLDTTVSVAPERDKTTTTTNLAYFYDRLRQEIGYSTEHALSFVLIVFRLPEGSSLIKELGELVASLIREYDLVYFGERAIAVLLAEAHQKGLDAFLERFHQRWKRSPLPMIEHRCFDRGKDFLETARHVLECNAGSGQSLAGG